MHRKLLFVVISTFLFLFIACSKDEDENDYEVQPIPEYKGNASGTYQAILRNKPIVLQEYMQVSEAFPFDLTVEGRFGGRILKFKFPKASQGSVQNFSGNYRTPTITFDFYNEGSNFLTIDSNNLEKGILTARFRVTGSGEDTTTNPPTIQTVLLESGYFNLSYPSFEP